MSTQQRFDGNKQRGTNDGATTVFMCPGQGAQKPGMGSDLKANKHYIDVFECASSVFGIDVAKLAEVGPAEELDQTFNAQAATLALSLAISRILIEEGIEPDAVLGFSLGQIAGLHVSGMLDLEDTFALAYARATAMQKAAEENPGAMCALVGVDAEAAQELCETCSQGEVLVPANFNCPGQIVISGSVSAIERAKDAWTNQGKRAVQLATSGAFHSPLMAEAATELSSYLAKVGFQNPSIPLICNTDAYVATADSIADRLVRHITHPVLFEQSVETLTAKSPCMFIEVGFGGVLNGLVRRIDKGITRYKAEDQASIHELVSVWGNNHE